LNIKAGRLTFLHAKGPSVREKPFLSIDGSEKQEEAKFVKESKLRCQATRIIRYVLAGVFVVCTFVTGCASAREDFELTQRAVDLFHSQVDSEQYSAIYQSADAKMQQATSESDFVKFLQGVHRKFGTVQNSTLRDRGIAFHTGQNATTRVVYETAFAGGSGTEKFVWQIRDKHATLYSYTINSKDLITK
jgi:hypothetical protein